MADFTNSELLKLFVRVPGTITNFNGESVTATSYKIYFEEAKSLIWAKGKPYGISEEYKNYVNSLLTQLGYTTDTANVDGSIYARIAAAKLATDELRATTYAYTDTLYADKDTARSIQNIAYGAANQVVSDLLTIGDDDTKINKVKEVLDWFDEMDETYTGMQLLEDVAGLRTDLGTKEDTASATGSAFAQIAYIKTQIADKNVGAEGETGANALVYSYATNNTVFTYSSDKLTTAVGLAESAAQSVSDSGVEGQLIAVTASGKAYTVAATDTLTTAVAKANSAAQSITTANDDLITVTPTGTAYEIAYTTALGTAVAKANSAIQSVTGETGEGALIEASTTGDAVTLTASQKLKDAIEAAEDSLSKVTVGSYTLTGSSYTVTKEQLKSDVLGDITGSTTYTDPASGIIVTITYSAGVITGVTLDGTDIDSRTDDIESFIQDYDPWMNYTGA